MEKKKSCNLFKEFAYISIIMKYCKWKHRLFLILSALWKSSRNKLNEYYDEFINIDKQNLLHIHINSKNMNKLWLPSELFEFDIDIRWNNDAEMFIDFLDNLINKKGYRFWENYMHNFVFISQIRLNWVLKWVFRPYIEDMKSIQNLSEPKEYEWLRKASSMFDWITLMDYDWREYN